MISEKTNPAPETPVVVYVAGMGRSGSTVLAATLAQVHGVISVGELDRLTRTETRGNQMCACGRSGESCSFWGEVLRTWRDRVTDDGVKAYGIYQSRLERLRSLPRLISLRNDPTLEFQEYSLMTSELLKVISEFSGSRVIVDTSKGPARGIALIMANGIRVHLVHLIRDGRGVLWSRKGRASRPGVGAPLNRRPGILTLRVTLEWIAINRICERVASMAPDGESRILYEQFARNPAPTVQQIYSHPEFDSELVDTEILGFDRVSFGHTMGGNPVRFSGDVAIQIDEEWHTGLSRSESRLFWLLAGRLAKRYGYHPV